MKYLPYILTLLTGVAIGWFIFSPNSNKIEEINSQREKLTSRNLILLRENVKLKKRIDKNLDVMQHLTFSIDSLKKVQLHERKKNANRISSLNVASDSTKIDIWAGYAGEK